MEVFLCYFHLASYTLFPIVIAAWIANENITFAIFKVDGYRHLGVCFVQYAKLKHFPESLNHVRPLFLDDVGQPSVHFFAPLIFDLLHVCNPSVNLDLDVNDIVLFIDQNRALKYLIVECVKWDYTEDIWLIREDRPHVFLL